LIIYIYIYIYIRKKQKLYWMSCNASGWANTKERGKIFIYD